MILFPCRLFSFHAGLFLIHKDDLVWASERFSADTRLDGETEIFRSDCGGKFRGRSADVCDRYRAKRESTTRGTLGLDGWAERGLAMLGVARLVARVRAGSLFGDVEVPNMMDYLRAEAMNEGCHQVKRTKSSSYPDEEGALRDVAW